MGGKATVLGKEAIPIIDNVSNLIHGGLLFTASIANAALGAGDPLYIEMVIPTKIEVHLKTSLFYNGDDGHFEIIEAPTLTTGVTPLVSYNRNRASIKASGIVLKSNPTGISGGTNLRNFPFKGTNQTPAILYRSGFEWILKSNTIYLLRLTNDGGAAQPAILIINWEERLE